MATREEWLARWDEGRIGFHEGEVNPHLVRGAERLLRPGSRVLVPLCGKSVDLAWLADRGCTVVGVELAERAVTEFFGERGLEARVRKEGAFRVHEAPPIELWCGDFFEFAPGPGAFDAIWDRGAWVAVEPQCRDDYAERLLAFLKPAGRLLVVTLAYDEAMMEGPPYSITPAEVETRFGHLGRLERGDQVEVVDMNPRFRASGLQSVQETPWLLTLREA